MSDGLPTPPFHDGTTAFGAGHGRVRLIRNHEGYDPGQGARQAQRLRPGRPGRRHHLAVRHPQRRARGERAGPERHRQQLQRRPDAVGQLALVRGVDRRPAARGSRRSTATCSRSRSAAGEPVEPVPIKAMGRFEHEACADRPAHGHRLHDRGQRRSGRRLLPLPAARPRQAAPRRHAADAGGGGALPLRSPTRARRSAGSCSASGSTSTIPIPTTPRTTPTRCSSRARAKGAAQFMGLEGAHWSKGSVYFVASEAGDADEGQIWRYTPVGHHKRHARAALRVAQRKRARSARRARGQPSRRRRRV